MADDKTGNGHGYGGDEEPTPAEPTGSVRVSIEARTLVNLGLEYNALAGSLWNTSRIYDSTAGDDRSAVLAQLIAELSAVIDATAKARAALMMKRGEAAK